LKREQGRRLDPAEALAKADGMPDARHDASPRDCATPRGAVRRAERRVRGSRRRV